MMRKMTLLAVAVVWQFVLIPGEAATIGLTRFGGCLTPPGGCTLTINDNDPVHDSNAALGVITFSENIGQSPDGIYSVGGTLFETIRRDGSGRVTGITLVLTEANVLGTSGGIGVPPHVLGQIAVLSGVPISSLAGVAGGVTVFGQYVSTAGVIGFADVFAEARVGGALLGRTDPPGVAGVPSPATFSGSGFGTTGPVSNLLIGTLNFEIGGGDGFVLPASADFSADEVPEPRAILIIISGLTALAFLRRRTQKSRVEQKGRRTHEFGVCCK
jgi:hypothetical protein